VEKIGKSKANDLRVQLEFPKDLIIYKRKKVEKLKVPKAPDKGVNPIEKLMVKKYKFEGFIGYHSFASFKWSEFHCGLRQVPAMGHRNRIKRWVEEKSSAGNPSASAAALAAFDSDDEKEGAK